MTYTCIYIPSIITSDGLEYIGATFNTNIIYAYIMCRV